MRQEPPLLTVVVGGMVAVAARLLAAQARLAGILATDGIGRCTAH
jgi:hypothetical protein